jgi:hypothetical protein
MVLSPLFCIASLPFAVCDKSKETTTSKFIVMWKDCPVDTEEFFKDHDIDVELLYDWDDEASVYEAEDTEDANDIMEDIIHVLEGCEWFGCSTLRARGSPAAAIDCAAVDSKLGTSLCLPCSQPHVV